DRKASVETEEEHRGPLRRGCARRLYPGFRHRKGQQEISEKRRVGIRGLQLRSRIGQVHGRFQKPLRLRTRVPYGREGEGLHLPPVPEALNPRAPTLSTGAGRMERPMKNHCASNSGGGHPQWSRVGTISQNRLN